MLSFIILFIARGRKREGELGGGGTRQVLVQAVEGRGRVIYPSPPFTYADRILCRYPKTQ